MSDEGKPMGPGSRIIRERAMAVLRETRAKIDPRLLAAMKERLSAVMPQTQQGQVMAPLTSVPDSPIPASLQPVPGSPVTMKPVVETKTVYPAKPLVVDPAATSEPVDRQKIAQIVLQYMKNREDKIKH